MLLMFWFCGTNSHKYSAYLTAQMSLKPILKHTCCFHNEFYGFCVILFQFYFCFSSTNSQKNSAYLTAQMSSQLISKHICFHNDIHAFYVILFQFYFVVTWEHLLLFLSLAFGFMEHFVHLYNHLLNNFTINANANECARNILHIGTR